MRDHLMAVLQGKLDRAREHTIQFQRESEAFLDGAPNRTLAGDDPKAADAFREFHRSRIVPVRLSILTGEVIQQLRSCLDHLACALIVRDGGEPTHQSQFPILLHQPMERKAQRCYESQVAGIEREAVRAVIEKHQPYHERPPQRHPLAILKDFSNADKHRSLLLHVVWPRGMTTLVVDSSGAAGREEGKATHGSILLDDRPATLLDVKNSLKVEVAFERWGDTRYAIDVTHGLKMMGDCVVAVINELSPFLA